MFDSVEICFFSRGYMPGPRDGVLGRSSGGQSLM